MNNPSDREMSFQHSASFEPGEISGNVRLGKLEMMYEELFAEVIEDGIITAEERQKLDTMAESLGLDRARLRNIEVALQAGAGASYLIDYARQIDDDWLDGVETVGVTSGASAPEDRVQGVLEELKARGVSALEEIKVRDEDMVFVPPREMKLLRMAKLGG